MSTNCENIQMQEESNELQQIQPESFLTLVKQINKSLDEIKKETIPAILSEISTAIQQYIIVQSQDIEEEIKIKSRDIFFECLNDVLAKFLSSTKLTDEAIFQKVRDTIQKIVRLLSQNLKQDNPLIRKCLVTLFNPESIFFSNELDPPNRFFFSELITDLKERRQWFDQIQIGDLVDAVKVEESYKKQSWSHARVADKTELRVKLEFLCDSNKYDRQQCFAKREWIQKEKEQQPFNNQKEKQKWVEWSSYELRQYKSRCQDFEWRQELKPNMIIDVCDTACVWYQSTILDTRNVIIEGNQEPIKELYIEKSLINKQKLNQDIESTVMMENSKIVKADSIRDGQANMMSGYQLIVLVYKCIFIQRKIEQQEYQNIFNLREKKMSKKLFKQASQNNSEKIIDDSNDIIFEYEYYYVKKIIAIHRVQSIFKFVNSSYIQFINDFGDGFFSILNLIVQSNKILMGQNDPNNDLKDPISFNAICDYIQIIYNVSPFFFKQFCVDYIPILNEAIKTNIYKSTENNIKSFKREQINEMIKNLGIILMRYYSIGEKIEILEDLEFQIAKMCFESASVKQNTIGLQLLTQIVQKYQKNSKKSYQLNELKNEIEKNKYIQQLFNEDTHIQLLEKSTDFFIFLIEQNLFTMNDMRNLWKVIQKSHDDTRICYYNLLKQVSKSLKVSHIKTLYEEINLKEDNKYKQYEIDILFEICFEEKFSQLERVALQTEIFNLIWNYINEFSDDQINAQELERSKMKQTVDKFCKLVKERKREQQVESLREKLIQNIKEGKNTYFSLEILESVMSQLNLYIETQRKEFEIIRKQLVAQNIATNNTSQIENREQSVQPQSQQQQQQQQNGDEDNEVISSNLNQSQNSLQIPTVVNPSSNLINITDLYNELETEFNNENIETIYRQDLTMIPNAYYSQVTQTYELPLSPSLRPQNNSSADLSFNPIITKDKDKKEILMQFSKLQIRKKQMERQVKCKELRQIVLDNLKQLKRKQNIEELKQSPSLIRSYICQIEKRINFLSFMNEECQIQVIDYELISELLDELIEKQLVSAESEFFYRWLKRSNKKSKIIIPYVRKFFLEKVVNDDHFISTLSLEGFDCFKSLFIQINTEIGNIVAINDHPYFKNIKDSSNKSKQAENITEDTNLIFGDYRVDFLYLLNKNPLHLEGLKFLWKITFLAQNEEVSSQGSIFLVNLYLRTTENLEDQLIEIRNQFLETCQKNIQEKQYLVRTFQLLHTFLDYSELKGIGTLIAHSAESIKEKNTLIIKNQLPESANIMKIQNQFQFPCTYQKTLYQLRVDLAQIFKIGIDELLILIPGKNDSYGSTIILKDHLNGYTLQALDFMQNQVVLIQKQQKRWNHPVKLIKEDDQLTNKALEVIKEWFKAYSENGRMSMQNCAHFIESCTKDVCKVDDYRVIDVFKNWDSDKDDYLSEQDFLDFYRKGSKEKKETVMRNIQAHYYSDDLTRIYVQFKNIFHFKQSFYISQELRIHLSQSEVKELPRYLLSQNEGFQKLIFETYEFNNEDIQKVQGRMRFLIEKIFSRLPTCTYIKSILEDSNKVQDIFVQPSRYEFYYILECIENKFFEGQGEQEQGQTDVQEIIQKLQEHNNQQSNYQQKQELKVKQQQIPQNQEQQDKQADVQTNQQVHQMSNENKIINVGFKNFISNKECDQRSDTHMNIESDWIINFFNKGLFEKILQKFDFFMQQWIDKNSNLCDKMVDEKDNLIKQNETWTILEQIQIKLFQKFFKMFNRFVSACILDQYPYIFYLPQYMGNLQICIEDIEEDISKRSSTQMETEQPNDKKEKQSDEINKDNPQLVGPVLPQDQNTYSVFGYRISAPKIDKFQKIMIEYVTNNSSLQEYLNKLSTHNIPSIIVNTLLQTLRQTNKFTTPYRNLVVDSLYTLLLLLYNNQEQFMKEFQEQPNTYILLKEGLFYQKNRIIRQIFSFFVFLLIRQTQEKSWMIKTLISLIPQSNQEDEQAETCSQFFSLICLILSKYQEKVSSDGFDFNEAFLKVFETLKNIQSKENPLNAQKDNLLNGYLQLTMTMLKNSKSISEKSEEEYVKYLIFNCLFHPSMINQPDYDNKSMVSEQSQQQIQQILQSISTIKCFHFDSRFQCYKQIQEICKQHPENIPNSILEYLSSIVKSVQRFSKQTQFNPESNIKSSQGYVGLKNLGAICYINSMIQQLLMCSPFVYSLLAADDLKDDILASNSQGTTFDDNVLHQIQRLFTFLILSIKKDYNPEGFCFSLKGYDGERTQTNLQQDTQEFLNLFVERIHSSLENTPFRCIFDTLYGVTTITERSCLKCNKKTQTEQLFYMIPIKIKGERTLISSLDKTFRQESIQDYKCDECKQISEAQSQEFIKNLPNMLILNLFRISHNIETGQNQKDNNKVTFEQNLNMYQFMYNPQNRMEVENLDMEDYQYTLKGVVVHNGTADYGHYFSFIKTQEDKWLEFNDSNISEYNPKEMANDCFGQDASEQKQPKLYYESQKSAYLLFYEKVKKNQLEFKVKNEQEQKEIITKLGIKKPTILSFWKASNRQQEEEEKQPKKAKGSEYFLRADYYDINLYITPKYQDQIALDNYQFICQKLILNNSFFNFIQETILSIPMPQFYLDELNVKPFKPYMPFEYLKQSESVQIQLSEIQIFKDKYDYPKILRLIAYIYFNFLTTLTDCNTIDNWFDLFYRFSTICPETACEIFKEYVTDKIDCFWQDILITTNYKLRSSTKQIVLHLLNIVIKSYQVNLLLDLPQEIPTNYFNPALYVNQFLGSLIQGLHSQIPNNLYRCEQYFEFLRDFVESDLMQGVFLLKNGMIDKLLDLYLGEESPIANKYYQAKKTNIGSGNQPQYQFNPLLATIYALLCKQNLIKFKLTKDKDSFDEELIKFSNDFESMIMSQKFYKRAFRMKSDPNILGKIISHMSYRNYKYSHFIASYIITEINDKFRSDDVTHYLELMSHFITILDDLKNHRFEWIFGIPQIKKNFMNQDFSFQLFLDDQYIEYISTLSPDITDKDQTKGFLCKVYDCNIGYANSREHYIVNKFYQFHQNQLLELMDANENIFNYVLTIPPPNYLRAYYIEFLDPYIKNNQKNPIIDAYSITLLQQIIDNYSSIQNKIKIQEEQFQKLSLELISLNKQSQQVPLFNQPINTLEERQIIFDTYIYGQTIQTKQVQFIQNVQNHQYLSCQTIEHEIYYCQNKLSVDGRNLIFPKEVLYYNRVDPWKINNQSNVYLLFNQKEKRDQTFIQNQKNGKQNQEKEIEEESKQNVGSSHKSSNNLRFSSESSISSNKAVKSQNQRNGISDELSQQLKQNGIQNSNSIQQQQQDEKILSQQSLNYLSETEINYSTNLIEQEQDGGNEQKMVIEKESDGLILLNIDGIKKDNCIREIELNNTSKTITYKVTLTIVPINYLSSILLLSNFKYPNMIERVIPPDTKCTVFTLTKNIPIHSWGDYELRFDVEIIKDTADSNENGQNKSDDFMKQLVLAEPTHSFKQMIGPIQIPKNNFNERTESECDQNQVVCKYCTLKNSSLSQICEICCNPLFDDQCPSPRSA